MSNPNLGWLFYKDYFRAIDDWSNPKESEKAISKKVDDIINIALQKEETSPLGNIHFEANTTYPGLLLGSGYAHELPHIEGQAILGFDFDYTSGLPIIRGSSIKGVLRSAFRHIEYIQELLNDDNIDIELLEYEIFDNSDIFFDATIISSGKILNDDYLAPHGDNPLKDPTPLRFIKVAPNVIFRFDFLLSDGLISKDEKRKLFQNILEDLGIGAKTNVGYGKFENFGILKTQLEKDMELKEQEEKKKRTELLKQEEIEKLKEEKAKKAQGIESLKDCKDIKSAMKIINESLGKRPKLTVEQKSIIEAFWKKYGKKASKSEVKFFKKFIIT